MKNFLNFKLIFNIQLPNRVDFKQGRSTSDNSSASTVVAGEEPENRDIGEFYLYLSFFDIVPGSCTFWNYFIEDNCITLSLKNSFFMLLDVHKNSF